MNCMILAAALLALTACSPAPRHTATPANVIPTAPTPSVQGLPSGAYTLDKAHASLIFRVDHLSFSHFTGRFTRWDATLQLDPQHPEAANISATIDPQSLESDNPPAGFLSMLHGPEWLNVAQFPQIAFHSTRVDRTGANTARITGDFTFHGVTKPLTLEATFNGGYAGNVYDRHARLGFSAHGTVRRSDFGMSIGLPPPGTTMGVGDEVEFIIETEFSGPAWTPAPGEENRAPN
ncbi:MAG: YceI family protein [Proteobacteria bacterium]|nr:YceI family protein [Pseudomonadota bacterium]